MALFRTGSQNFFIENGHYIANDTSDNVQSGQLGSTPVIISGSTSRGNVIINTNGISSISITFGANTELIGCAFSNGTAVTPAAFKTTQVPGTITMDVSNYELLYFTVAGGTQTVSVAKAS